jgi:hypothetical protein
MKRTLIVLIAIMGITLLSSVASASYNTKPGTGILLQLKDFDMETTGFPIAGGWQPASVKWYLIDPYGNTNMMVDSKLDSVVETGKGFAFASTTWVINTNSGMIKIPAFATPGNWILRAKFYDNNNVFIISWSNKAVVDVAQITVQSGSITDSITAPMNIYWKLGDAEISFSTPDISIFIVLAVLIFIILLNIIAFKSKRREEKI